MEKLITTILAEYLKTEKEDVTLNDHLQGDLGLTSLDMMEIVTTFENEFDIEIEDAAIMNFVEVRDIFDYINQKCPD